MLAINPESLQLDCVIAVEEDFDFIGPEYTAFFNLQRGTIFQSPLWMGLIHRRLVPNLSARQYTITFRRPFEGTLLAVIPSVIQQAGLLKILQPADFGVCDYNCVVGDELVLETLAADSSIGARLGELMRAADVLPTPRAPVNK